MSARPVVWAGETIGMVVTPGNGEPGYLVPPVVFDEDGQLVLGLEVVAAVAAAGVEVEVVVIRGCGPGRLAKLERRLAHVRELLGIESLVQ